MAPVADMTQLSHDQWVTLDVRSGLVYSPSSDHASSPGTPLPFRQWCASHYAPLRWRQLVTAGPGQQVLVEQVNQPGGPHLLQLTGLDAAGSTSKRFEAYTLTQGELRQKSLETVAAQVMALVTNLVMILDEVGRITYASDSVHQCLGYTAAALLGQSARDLLEPENLLQCGDTDTSHVRLWRVRHRDGSWKTLEVKRSDLLDDPVVAGLLLVARDVTDEQRMQQAFLDQGVFYQEILEDLPLQVAVLDAQGRYLYVNPAAVRNPEVRQGIIGRTDREYCAWRGHDLALAERRLEYFNQAAASGLWVSWDESMRDPRGLLRHHQRHYLPVFGADGRLSRMIGYGQDHTERQRQLLLGARQTQVLKLSAERAPLHAILSELRAALQDYFASDTVTLHLNRDGPITLPLSGITAPIMAGTSPLGCLHLSGLNTDDAKDAERVLDHAARLAGLVSERAQQLEQLETLAYVDPLTALPNRAAFVLSLQQALSAGPSCSVIVADLKAFWRVNTRYGHATGDAVLKRVAQQLQEGLPVHSRVARIGGNAFALLVASDTVDLVVAGVAKLLSRPTVIRGETLAGGVHVGVSQAAQPGDEAEQIVRQAEQALHRAKQLGQPVSRYNAEDDAVELTALILEEELRHAFSQRALSLVYQPLVDARTGEPHSVEVLLRWNHPERGPVSPQVFVALAEQSDLIVDIGRWVLCEACRQIAAWPGVLTRLNVNVSARQFQAPNFVDDVAAALRDSGLPAASLELELTESVLMTSGAALIEVIERLSALGVRLALDDYGTGYSSLAYLHRFPLDVLKIDRSFVQGLTGTGGNHKEMAIVRSTVALAHELGLQVVAEGIEDIRQQDILVGLGCDLLQGFLFSAPVPLEAAVRWASDRRLTKTASAR